MYINIRSKDMYQALEHGFQARITKALEGPNPDMAALLADAQAMLAKYDEAISLVAKATRSTRSMTMSPACASFALTCAKCPRH